MTDLFLRPVSATDIALYEPTSPDLAGSFAGTEASDAVGLAGGVTISGSFVIADETDAVAIAGAVGISGSFTAQEFADIGGSGTYWNSNYWETGFWPTGYWLRGVAGFVGVLAEGEVSGSFSVIEPADSAGFGGFYWNSGYWETGFWPVGYWFQGLTGFAGQIKISGTFSPTEAASETFAALGKVYAAGSFAQTEGLDSAVIAGSLGGLSGLSGVLAASEGSDTAQAAGTVQVSGPFTTLELSDFSQFAGAAAQPGLSGVLESVEGSDNLQFDAQWPAPLTYASGPSRRSRVSQLDYYREPPANAAALRSSERRDECYMTGNLSWADADEEFIMFNQAA